MAKRKHFWTQDNRPKKYSLKKCKKHNHHDSTGGAIYFSEWGGCVACYYDKPDGLFEHNFTDIAPATQPKYATAEEKRQAHIESVKAWNKRNKEKTEVYRKTYGRKPEVLKRRSEHAKMLYDLKISDPNYVPKRRPTKLDGMTLEEIRAHKAKMERERYHALSPEKKAARYARTKERVLAKRLREENDQPKS